MVLGSFACRYRKTMVTHSDLTPNQRSGADDSIHCNKVPTDTVSRSHLGHLREHGCGVLHQLPRFCEILVERKLLEGMTEFIWLIKIKHFDSGTT